MPLDYTVRSQDVQAMRLLWTNWSEMCEFAGVGPIQEGRPEGCFHSGSKIGLRIPRTNADSIVAEEGEWIVIDSAVAASAKPGSKFYTQNLMVISNIDFTSKYTPTYDPEPQTDNPARAATSDVAATIEAFEPYVTKLPAKSRWSEMVEQTVEKMVDQAIHFASPNRKSVFLDIVRERDKQIRKGFTFEHDDEHTVAEFADFIRVFAGRATFSERRGDLNGLNGSRKRMIQVAALAVACVEAIDRKVTKVDARIDEAEG